MVCVALKRVDFLFLWQAVAAKIVTCRFCKATGRVTEATGRNFQRDGSLSVLNQSVVGTHRYSFVFLKVSRLHSNDNVSFFDGKQ